MQRGADPMIGRVLDGRYRILARVARGGMATVFRAHDQRLDRGCAVKVMHTDLGDDDDFTARFVREAHAAARLSHPNVVAVTDQGDDEGVLFLVMEYVPGQTLRDVIRAEAPMDPSRALALLEPVLRALAEAHRCRLVHRDVKPENVLIGDDGVVKVADFGLARAFDANTTSTVTGGLLIGTVSYLAPEIIVSGKADPRSDVYAAGVLLFEMLTGHKPHQGDGAIQVAFKHVNEDVPAPSSVLPAPGRTSRPLPAYLDALVLRATARERERRPADAKVLLHQVRRVRAAIEAGDLDDPELTSDLLPAPPVQVGEPFDYVDERDQTLESEPVTATRLDTPVVDLPLLEPTEGTAKDTAEPAEETTVVIDRVGTPAGVGVGAGAGPPTRRTSTDGPVPSGSPPRPAPPPPPTRGPTQPRAGRGGTGAARADGQRATRPAGTRPGRGPLRLAAAVALAVLVAYAGWWIGIGRYTSTPGVVNLPLAAASEKAEAAGLDVEVTERVFSETVTAGSVISTEPAAGSRILDGDTVELVVSKGPERYAVPTLAGVPFDEVALLLAEVNLEAGEVEQVWHDKVPDGEVVATEPVAGTELRRGDTVDLTVSKGRQPLEVPDHTGKPADAAREELTELGFEVASSEENHDEVPKGRVISQTPREGTGFKGDTVALVVSKGPVLVEIPNVRTMGTADATAALEKAGFVVTVERTDLYVGLDRVVRQGPGPGKKIPRGSTVIIGVV